MRFIDSLSLRAKLALLVLVPAIGLLALAITDVRPALQIRAESKTLLGLVELSVTTSDMVHELQKERGLSAGYLGSSGTKFAQKLAEQRNTTDAKIDRFETQLKNLDLQRFTEEFGAKLALGLSQLQQLPAIRMRVEALDIGLADGIQYYTAANKSFLELVEFLPKLSSDGAVSVSGTAYAAFLQSKERAGIERAVLANTFASDSFAPGFYQRFTDLVNTQSVYLDVFRTSSSNAQKNALADLLQSPVVTDTERMRRVAKERAGVGQFGIDPTYWFDRQTEKINLLKDFENRLAADLSTLTQAGYAAANARLINTMASAGIPLVLAIVLGIVISAFTLRQLGTDPNELNRIMQAIANNDLDLDLSASSPATGVFASAQIMQRNLQQRQESDQKLLAENGRIRKALTTVNGNVLIAGADNVVIYANDAMLSFFADIVRRCNADNCSLPCRELIGADMDILHADATATCKNFAGIKHQETAQLCIGPYTIDIVANPVLSDDSERIGTVFEWTDRTEDLIEAARVQATLAENGRIRQALTNVDGNVMIAGLDQQVVYANNAMHAFFAEIQEHIAGVLPGIAATPLMQVDVDVLHRKQSGAKSFFATLPKQLEARMVFGPITLDYVANPVFSEDGNRLGTVFEWTDRTEDLIEAERVQATLAENGRIRQALTNVDGNVMIADLNQQVVYANKTMLAFFADIRDQVSHARPGMDTASLLQADIDVLHQKQAGAMSFFASLSEKYEARMTMGSVTLDYVANPVFSEGGERLGTVFEWKDRTEDLIEAERTQVTLAENGRIRQALTNAVGCVMIAGPDDKIVYANKAMADFYQEIRTAIQSEVPEISSDRVIGLAIDKLHKTGDPRFFTALTTQHKAQLEFGKYTIDYFANPVYADDGQRIGTVFEWVDRTTELIVEAEVQAVVDAALAGDLSRRITEDGKENFFATLSNSVNQLMSIADSVVQDTMRVFAAVATGKLTETIETEYVGAFNQLKTDANKTISKLTEVVGDIQRASGSVKTAASEISQGNLDLSQRTESQASSLEETASSMEEMTSTVKQNAENAMAADELARAAREHAERGGAVVNQAVKAMRDINDSSKKIADIIGVIDEIAFQTNLLALNASVEAARAGDQGRGFAVVASEVRNLAGRSATAAREIKDLIEDSTRKVSIGTGLVEQSGGTLEEIVSGVKNVTTVVAEIAVASQQQSAGINEVNKSILQMDDLTQQNAALVEEAAAASNALGDQADQLNSLVQFFAFKDSSKATGSTDASPRLSRPMAVAKTPPTLPTTGNVAVDQDWVEF